MKRSTLLILVLVLGLAMVLVGCGKDEAQKTEPAGETTGNATEGTAQETEGDPTGEATNPEEIVDTNPEGDPGIGGENEDDPGVDIYLPGGGNNTGENERPTGGEGNNEGGNEGQPPEVTTPSAPEEDNGEDDFQVDFGDLLG